MARPIDVPIVLSALGPKGQRLARELGVDPAGGPGRVGTPAEIAARAHALGADGATELLFNPTGPDIGRELRAFARALGR